MDQLFVNAPPSVYPPPPPPQPVATYPHPPYPSSYHTPPDHDEYYDDLAELPSTPKKDKQIRRRISKGQSFHAISPPTPTPPLIPRKPAISVENQNASASPPAPPRSPAETASFLEHPAPSSGPHASAAPQRATSTP